VTGTTAIGAAIGIGAAAVSAAPTGGTSFLVLPLEGTALGFATGYLLCPYLAPRIKEKIMGGVTLSQAEVESAAGAMSRYAGAHRDEDALALLARVRVTVNNGLPTTAHDRCIDPVQTGWELVRKA
jgi:hypothetical protein